MSYLPLHTRPAKNYPRSQRMLVAIGHSAQKAAEIILDARRGDNRARQWLRICRRFYAKVGAL